jgi:cytoskeletal protein CcmA (bactofilin family)
MTNKQAVLGAGARFSGKISNAKSIEINGYVEADLATEKVTIGSTGKFLGKVDSELVVIAGEYEGKMKADSVWLTESSRISGEVHYKSLQMDRGAALNCRVVHNWNENESAVKEKNQQNVDGAEVVAEVGAEDSSEEGQSTKK